MTELNRKPTPFLILVTLFVILIAAVGCNESPKGPPNPPIDTLTTPQTPISAFEWTCEREDSLRQVDTTLLNKALAQPESIREYFAAYAYKRYGGQGMDFSCSKEDLAAFIQYPDWRLACVLVEEIRETDRYIEFRHRLNGSYEEMKLLAGDSGMLVLRSGVFCEGQCEYEISIAQVREGEWVEKKDSLLPEVTWLDFMKETPDADRIERIEKSIQFAVGYSLPVEGSTLRAWLNEEWAFGEMQSSDRFFLDNAYNELDLVWEDGKYVIGEKRRRLEH